MSEKLAINKSTLDAIGDAVREKKGTEDLILVEDLADEVKSIESGGDTTYEDWLITRDYSIREYENNRVTSVGTSCFSGMSDILTSISFPNVETIGNSAFYSSKALKSCYIPKVKTIGNTVFYGSTELEYLDLPCVESIGTNTFYGCRKLATLIIRTENCTLAAWQSLNATAIYYEDDNAYIYVPKSAIDTYKTATNWSRYADRFRAIEDYPEICGGAE